MSYIGQLYNKYQHLFPIIFSTRPFPFPRQKNFFNKISDLADRINISLYHIKQIGWKTYSLLVTRSSFTLICIKYSCIVALKPLYMLFVNDTCKNNRWNSKWTWQLAQFRASYTKAIETLFKKMFPFDRIVSDKIDMI